MATGQHRTGLLDLLQATPHYFGQDPDVQLLRPDHDVQRRQRPAAHGVDIRQGVGGGDAAEPPGVVNDGREEVQGLDQGPVAVHLVDAGVLVAHRPHQQVRVAMVTELMENLPEAPRRQLGGSTATGAIVRQPDRLFLSAHLFLFYVFPASRSQTRPPTA